jgi:DNA repair ATPase RecN
VVYSRFYKADLQMQTPVDRSHWRGPERLLPNAAAEERSAVAEQYIRRCYEVGLELIAITEHNICPGDCDSLIPELQSAIRRLRREYDYEIVLFPGFEVSAPLGKGVHLLCIFEPGTPVSVLDEKLAELGLPKSRRFENGAAAALPTANLARDKIVQVIQEDPSVPGLIILAHAAGNSGVLDNKTIEQWWSMDVIRDERLLCLELPRPREHYLAQEQSLLRSILLNQDCRYARRHPMASICSSDCKRLREGEGNHIGFRHTWMKMAAPSIEGLRQAFLDHESRIRFGSARPEEAQLHPRVKRFSVSNVAFLADEDIEFSPNLNVIIGGSGSGKSTTLNYLRMCLGQDGDIHGDDVKSNYRRTLQTVGESSKFEVEYEADALHLELEGSGRGRLRLASEEETGELTKLAPVRFYGQREIYNIAEDRAATRRLLDDLVRDDLDALGRESADLIQTIQALQNRVDQAPRLRSQQRELTAEMRATEARLAKLKSAAEPLTALSEARDHSAQLLRLRSEREAVGDKVDALVDSLGRERDESTPSWLTSETVELLWSRTRSDREALLTALKQAASQYQAALNSAWESAEAVRVREAEERAVADTEAIRADLESQGVDLGDLASLQDALSERLLELNRVTDQLDAIDRDIPARDTAIHRLHDCWQKEVVARGESAQKINEAVPATRSGLPFVHVVVEPYGDERDFERALAKYRGDKRRISDDDWSALISGVAEGTPQGTSPMVTLLHWLDELRQGNNVSGFPWGASERQTQRLLEWFTPSACIDLRIQRVADRVVVTLRRQDGTEAGQLEGGLSVGQKCTAVLAILLALDTAPAVIDQPEEEIDNEFTYREMVPLLRRVKERRQLIIVTHDPNIPVNADAEMILALEANGGRGVVKTVQGQPTVGALDQEHVRLAVEEILEGSEEAFRRRFVKYGF